MFTPVRQRLVRTHPVTGRKSLYLSSHIGTIIGWPMPEARAFIRDLTEHAVQEQFLYRHVWRQYDLVMWDNRTTMHRVTRFDETQVRDMRRTTVAGDGVTVVVSLMRREKTGVFPAAEFALLADAEPFVAAFVRQVWSGLADRFALAGQGRGRRSEPVSAADKVWRKLNLTDREASIIELVLQGHSSESIGLKLNISTGTVKVHRRNVYRKLGISSQIQLLSIYLKNLQA